MRDDKKTCFKPLSRGGIGYTVGEQNILGLDTRVYPLRLRGSVGFVTSAKRSPPLLPCVSPAEPACGPRGASCG